MSILNQDEFDIILSSTSSQILIYFYTDVAVGADGFEFDYWLVIVASLSIFFKLHIIIGWTILVQLIVLVKVSALIMAHASVTQDGMVNYVTFLHVQIIAHPTVNVMLICVLASQVLEVSSIYVVFFKNAR